jgi:hypothetical protein
MSCECVQSAIIVEEENEKLREKIHRLEKTIIKYQDELLFLYNSNSSSDEQNHLQKSESYIKGIEQRKVRVSRSSNKFRTK